MLNVIVRKTKRFQTAIFQSLIAGYRQISPSEGDLYYYWLKFQNNTVKQFRPILKLHSPKEPVRFVNEPAEVFFSYISELHPMNVMMRKILSLTPIQTA